MSEALLYRWPAPAKFGRVVPKSKFYEQGTVPAAIRQKFVNDVQRITWAYKLAESTIHLRGTDLVPEIQVFTIEVKDAPGGNVADEVLAAIDKAVQFHVIFEIHRGTGDGAGIRMTAADKILGGSRPLQSPYFSTAWMSTDSERVALPPALDLAGLHAALVAPLLPVPARPGERLSEVTARITKAVALQREITSLEKRLRAEPQLNRKIDLRRLLKHRTQELAELTDTALSTKG